MYFGALRPASNKVSWAEPVAIIDDDTDEAFDLTDFDIVVSVRDQKSECVVLTAEIGSGVTVTDAIAGEFQWRFTREQMRTLKPETYDIGIVIDQDGDDAQLLVGTIRIVDGIVA